MKLSLLTDYETFQEAYNSAASGRISSYIICLRNAHERLGHAGRGHVLPPTTREVLACVAWSGLGGLGNLNASVFVSLPGSSRLPRFSNALKLLENRQATQAREVLERWN